MILLLLETDRTRYILFLYLFLKTILMFLFDSRFSGVTEKDLEGVKTTIRDVQAVLLSMFSSDTILCGHSLESDLKALKVKCIRI